MNGQEKTPDLLLELGNLTARRTRDGQLQHALRTALALTDGDAAVVHIPSARRVERLVMYAGSPAPAKLPAEADASLVVSHLAGCVEPLAVADLSQESHLMVSDACPGVEAGPALFTALRLRDPLPGYLAVYRRCGRARFAQADVRALLLLSGWLVTALECLRLSSGVEKVALGDDLTGVYNARFLKRALQRELQRAGRYGQEVSLVLADVDRLGALNAEHGELRGSVLLREMAVLLAQQVRSFDLLARCGADEFMLVLPQTGRSGAVELAERLRAVVERHAFTRLPAGAVTLSLGVVTFPQEGTKAKALTAAADRALTRARQNGMNRVETLDRCAA